MIRSVLFDLGDTLIRNLAGGRQAYLGELADAAGHALGRGAGFRGEFLEAWDEWSAENSPRSLPLSDFLRRLAPDEDAGALEAAITGRDLDLFVGMPGAASTLATLRRRGIRTGVLSNTAFPESHARALLNRCGLPSERIPVVVSCEVGMLKPSLAAFEAGLRALDSNPAETCFVGDNPLADAAGAVSAGFGVAFLLTDDDTRTPPGATSIRRIPDMLPLLAELRGSVRRRRGDFDRRTR